MLKRKVERILEQWKESFNKKPLIIKGVRQCGKTYSILDFAQKNYKNVVYLNFLENPNYSSIFAGSLKVDDLIIMISTTLGNDVIFESGNTCIIFDEIQECPEARTSLKFFKLDGRFDVLCTGSLLGVSGYASPKSVPVGYEKVVKMYPMDFEEFLWANGIGSNVIDLVKSHLEHETKVPDAIHNRFRKLFLQYCVVGGMPEVVSEFISSLQMNAVLELQRSIVSAYEDDMLKYALTSDKSQIRECFQSIPKQLAKENKKFQYSIIRKGSTAARYMGSLQWIEDAGIISRCYNLNIPELPLDGNAINEVFKVYMADTGLFISMLEDGTQLNVLAGNLYGYKGAIFENLIADIFHKMGRKLYYFHKDSGLEMDFFIRYKNRCVPVEVKSTTGNSKSLKTLLNHSEKYHITEAIKLGDYNVGRNGQILTLPSYMAFLLREV